MGFVSVVAIFALGVLAIVACGAIIHYVLRLFNMCKNSRIVSAQIKKTHKDHHVSTMSQYTQTVTAWFRAKRSDFDISDSDDADIDDEAAALLSVLPLDVVVVAEDGEVIRASSSAYQYAIVSDDSIINSDVAKAVKNTFANSETQNLEIVTRSAGGNKDLNSNEQNNNDEINDLNSNLDVSNLDNPTDETNTTQQYQDGIRSRKSANKNIKIKRVTRRNWLKITTIQVNPKCVVVLIDNVSEQRRFMLLRDDFVVNVTEQLLKPTLALEKLGSEISSSSLNNKQIHYFAQQIQTYSLNLNHMVSDLLLLLRAQEPVSTDQENCIEIKPIVNRVVSKQEKRAQELNIRIHYKVDSGLKVNVDIQQLEGALTKLIDNALDYSPRGNEVSIIATFSKDKKKVIIRVVDQGIGIALDDQAHIFERFWHGSEHTEHSGNGTGLGLAIVKHVALTNHGSLSVWSKQGSGSTFTLILPQCNKRKQNDEE